MPKFEEYGSVQRAFMREAAVCGVALDDPRATEGRLARLVRDELIEQRTSRAGRVSWRLTTKGRALLQTEGDPEIVTTDYGSGVKRDTARRRHGRGKARTVMPGPDILTSHTIDTLDYWRRNNAATMFVYFIQEGTDGPLKIGEAVNPVKRLEQMQTGNPRHLRVAAVILAGRSTEWQLHGYWRHKAWIRGEWFGRGHHEDIIARAVQIADAQIEAHKAGASLDDVRDKVFVRELFRETERHAEVV
jgi:hypothetical protein